MVLDTTVRLSKEFRDYLSENMKHQETYEDFIKKFIKVAKQKNKEVEKK